MKRSNTRRSSLKRATTTGFENFFSYNVVVRGRRSRICLEPEIWDALLDICVREGMSVCDLITIIDGYKRKGTALISAIRVFVVSYYVAAATEDGHKKADHNLKACISIPRPGISSTAR